MTCKPGNVILMDTPERGENTRYFVPMFEDVDLSFGKGYAANMGVTTDPAAKGWSVSAAGDYIVYISCSDNKYQGKKHAPRKYVYIVGGCCELPWNYWDESNNCFSPNPENANELVWEGELATVWTELRSRISLRYSPKKVGQRRTTIPTYRVLWQKERLRYVLLTVAIRSGKSRKMAITV